MSPNSSDAPPGGRVHSPTAAYPRPREERSAAPTARPGGFEAEKKRMEREPPQSDGEPSRENRAQRKQVEPFAVHREIAGRSLTTCGGEIKARPSVARRDSPVAVAGPGHLAPHRDPTRSEGRRYRRQCCSLLHRRCGKRECPHRCFIRRRSRRVDAVPEEEVPAHRRAQPCGSRRRAGSGCRRDFSRRRPA